jgi:hypothetical protein
VIFAACYPWPHIAEFPIRARTLFAIVLVAGSVFANHSTWADPPVTPLRDTPVMGFGVDRQLTPVPGFGTAGAAVSEDQRDEGPKDVKDKTDKKDTTDLTDTKDLKESKEGEKNSKGSPHSKSYRVRSPYERSSFPSGVPEWFKQRDANFDGQVFMSEYASSWTDETARTFSQLDPNGDGVITARESVMRRDVEVERSRGLASGVVRSNPTPMIARSRVAESNKEPLSARSPTEEKTQIAVIVPTQPEAEQSPLPHSIPQVFVAYADGVIKRFDTDRDGVLTATEWTAMPATPATADSDGNGQITANELAVWYVRKR